MLPSPACISSSAITLAAGVSRDYLLHHRLCPKERRDDGTLVVAVAPDALPDGVEDALDDLAFAYRAPVTSEVAPSDEVERLIERVTTHAERTIELARANVGGDADDLTADVRDLANQPPVVRYVNLLVRDAYDAHASDIHLEATPTGVSARFRLDGVLAPAPAPPASLHHAVVSRIKLLAELDIAERRRPQDGRIRVRLEARELDLRVSTVPTMYGESVVLRLLDRGGGPVSLAEVGMSVPVLAALESLARRPHGMLLVTGPTGSGKTTTLYAALQTRDAQSEKIITVEDPVEYQLAGITQVPVHRQAGVAFGSALRAILRQDPDVVMVGEMRDAETAEVAIQAAMTGHLVFSTLHTNDAIGAIPRLMDLGVPEYLVSATVEGVLAQRLVRRVCDACRSPYEPSAESLAALENANGSSLPQSNFSHGTGCAECRGTGFRGRLGLFELLIIGDELRDAIPRRAGRSALRALALRSGMVPLRSDGWLKALAGLTTVEEVLRAVHE